MDIEVAVLSYDGALTFGITADRDSCPDVEVFVEGVELSFRQLDGYRSPIAERKKTASL